MIPISAVQESFWPRTLAEAVADAQEWVDRSRADHRPRREFVLFSGGNDSLVLLHLAIAQGWAPDGVVHVNTGTGIEDTTEFVRQVCFDWKVKLHELRPPLSYEQVFIEDPIISGLPGPGMHFIAYNRLKERALRPFVQAQKRAFPIGWHDRVGLLTGIRRDESVIRMGYKDSVIDREGASVWTNPLYYFTHDEMAAYRAEHCLPVNPVAEHLHISGECLCGAYARPGELEMIRFFYPHVAARIEGWQTAAKAKGLPYWRWGERRGDEKGTSRMCQQCVGQMSLDGGQDESGSE